MPAVGWLGYLLLKGPWWRLAVALSLLSVITVFLVHHSQNSVTLQHSVVSHAKFLPSYPSDYTSKTLDSPHSLLPVSSTLFLPVFHLGSPSHHYVFLLVIINPKCSSSLQALLHLKF